MHEHDCIGDGEPFPLQQQHYIYTLHNDNNVVTKDGIEIH